jgi:hypothetical protein
MQSEILPSELQMVAPPTVPQARSYMFKQQSENTEYNVSKGERIRINIPRLQRSYLMKDSYIRFRVNMDVNFTGTNAQLWLDRCGAFGLFDRIEVYDYLGGTLLEQTSNLPNLATVLGDLNYSFMDFNGKLQATQGYDGSNVQTAATDRDQYEVRTANAGMNLIPAVPNTTARFMTVEFSLPVLSFLGVFSEKYVPLHNGFSIDFFLNDPALAFVSRSGANDTSTNTVVFKEIWVSNFEWCCQIMELGEVAESMVMATNPMVIHAIQYRNFQDIILGSGAQSSFRLDMNLNVVSLRNIRFTMRPYVYQALQYPSYGHRIRNFLQNWNFQYGSSYLPEIAGITTRSNIIPVTRNGYTTYVSSLSADWYKASGFSQSYMELAKTSDFNNPCINWSEYRIDLGSASTNDYATALTGGTAQIPVGIQGSGTICGKFAGGLNTRLNSRAISGIDTNGLLVCINGQFDTSLVGSMAQSILDVYAEHDAFIQVIPGVATTTTF